jgi:hypothetical protein
MSWTSFLEDVLVEFLGRGLGRGRGRRRGREDGREDEGKTRTRTRELTIGTGYQQQEDTREYVDKAERREQMWWTDDIEENLRPGGESP